MKPFVTLYYLSLLVIVAVIVGVPVSLVVIILGVAGVVVSIIVVKVVSIILLNYGASTFFFYLQWKSVSSSKVCYTCTIPNLVML